jgi:hypothetical protein
MHPQNYRIELTTNVIACSLEEAAWKAIELSKDHELNLKDVFLHEQEAVSPEQLGIFEPITI